MIFAPIMAVMIGIPGSGKSTFCRTELSGYERINLDELHTRNKENIAIESAVTTRKNIVIDNTNPSKEDRAKYIARARKSGYIVAGYFMQSVLKDCFERNNQRSGKEKLSYKAVAGISKKLELPTYDEGFDKIYFVRIEDGSYKLEDWRTN